MSENKMTLEAIAQDKTLFLDMYGVLWSSFEFYDGVLESLENLKKNGQKICILSNLTFTKDEFVRHHAKSGMILGTHYDEVITSGAVFLYATETGFFEKLTNKDNYKIFIVGKVDTELFDNVPEHLTNDITKADCLYFSTVQTAQYPDALDIDHLMPYLQYGIHHKIPGVCANPDLSYMRGNTRVPAQGTTAVTYQQMGGDVTYFGKPYPYIFNVALEKMQATPANSLMVGDTLETDIQGAKAVGMKTLLITKTGITHTIMESGETLSGLYEKRKVVPDYTTPLFAQKAVCEHARPDRLQKIYGQAGQTR